MKKAAEKRILADSWYANVMSDFCDRLNDRIDTSCWKWLRKRAHSDGPVRDLVFYWLSREYELILSGWGKRGRWLLIALLALERKRRLVLIEFIPFACTGNTFRRFALFFRDKLVVRPLLRRVLKSAHVLSTHEIALYSRYYRLGPDQLFFVKWPTSASRCCVIDRSKAERRLVVASGRMHCDWDTLLRAAEGSRWKVVLVCGAKEYHALLPRIVGLDVELRQEISLEEHQNLLQRAAVYVISVKNVQFSVGQIRVRNAVSALVPIVATRVPGLLDYLSHGCSARMFDPGDWRSLRQEIDNLISDEALGKRLASNAYSEAARFSSDACRVTLRKKIFELLSD